MKDLQRINAFLQALDTPAHRAMCEADTLLVELCEALVERQTRYRKVQDAHGSEICGDCPHGGCCKREFVRVFDLIFRLALKAPILPAVNADETYCSFLGATGCTLTPAPLPRVCVTFQCTTLSSSGPEGFGFQSATIAKNASDITRVLFTYVMRQYMLLDAESEIVMDSSAALVAKVAALPLQLIPRHGGPEGSVARPKKQILSSEPIGKLPIVDD